jgi:hypothetical protein
MLHSALSRLFCDAQDTVINLEKIYQDETHCLGAPEIRNDADMAISCFAGMRSRTPDICTRCIWSMGKIAI